MPEYLTPKLISWASILENSTRDQAIRTADMPFVQPHMALMPDAHLGKGATVGSVIPTVGAVMPAAVGVDIGCGMIAVRTSWTTAALDGLNRSRLHRLISSVVPLSAGKYNRELYAGHTRHRVAALEDRDGAEQAERSSPNWRLQLGSLGSGNHFIEVSVDEQDRVWLFLHSGSRGVGNRLASSYIRTAQQLCRDRRIDLPDADLAYLSESDPAFSDYLDALHWAQEFALLNRAEMMDRVVEVVGRWVGEPVRRTEEINCHHNYTVRERHFGREVWLSRKGAIDAGAGVAGVIPGSMGAASYVVRGRGNALALRSSPHGAGRQYSRNAARRRFTRADLNARMAGIAWGESDAFLDEHPDAYKDIDVVMADAADLVEVTHTLRQIVNVKGD